MNLRNRLYRHQYRSYNNISQLRSHFENHDQIFEKQLSQIQNCLQIMNTAFKNNIKIQQIYLDLIKARIKNTNLKAKDIKNVYQVLSENKTGQINFTKIYQQDQKDRKDKQQNIFYTTSLNNNKIKDFSSTGGNKINSKYQQQFNINNQKNRNSQNQQSTQSSGPYQKHQINLILLTYRRLYSRLIQAMVKKLTYYILNKSNLHKIIIHTVSEITKKLQILMRRIMDLKDFKFLFEVIRLIYDENLLIQQKIYQVMVDEGHVISIQEFFRINGILLQQAQLIKRNSRLSILSNQRLSILSKQNTPLQDIDQQRTKDSKFYQNIQKFKSTKKIDQQKNILYIQRLNKEIQSKYAAALDKIGDLLAHRDHQSGEINQQLQEQISKLEDEQPVIIGSEDELDQDEGIQSPYERWRRQNQQKKSSIKKRSSNFQYFSSDFKDIIQELDQKKGKTVVSVNSQEQNLDKANSSLQASQFEKINKQTISLQNPVNVARLLGKKFKDFSPSGTALSYMSRTGHHRQTSTQHNQINKLLKIYQNNQKQNHVIDILFMNASVDEEHKNLQKNFIKINLMAKLKQQKYSHLKGNINSDMLENCLMKQIQEEYQKLLALRLKKKQNSKVQIGRFDIKQNDKNEQVDNVEINIQKKRKAINLQKSFEQSQISVSKKQKETKYNLFQINKSIDQQNKSWSDIKQNSKLLQRSINFRKTHHPQLSKTQKQLITLSNTFKGIQPTEFINMNSIYGEFTNPLTKNCGYYNMEKYTSLRNSLQKCQVNSIKVKKGIQKKNKFQIGSKVAFWNKIRQHQHIDNKHNTFKSTNKQNQSKIQPNSNSLSSIKPFEKIDTNIYKNSLFKKIIVQHDLEPLDGQYIMKPKKSAQKQVQSIFHSKSQRNSFRNYNIQLYKVIDKNQNCKGSINVKKMVNSIQNKQFGIEFMIKSQKIRKQNSELKSDDLDLFIEKYLQKNKKPAGVYSPIIESIFKPELSTRIPLLVNTPRNSVNKQKQLYSTQRRMKIS